MRQKLIFLPACLLLFAGNLSAQMMRKVLFLGNSYTGTNNLPQMIKDVALSAGDTLVFDSNMPGGYTLEGHSLNPTSQNKIMAGGWHYVVMQGQSQEPIMQSSVFFQGGHALVDMITTFNPCAVPMLYMTWGRKNGDAPNCPMFPVMCTYAGMDSTLRHRYLDLAAGTDAEISPVSVVWNYLRQHHPGIELYQGDESHPSLAGSYAAACCFYAAIFKKDPTLITHNGGVNATDAAIIRNAASIQVFDRLDDWDYKQLPQSVFHYTIGAGANEVLFSPVSNGAIQTYHWDFGDGLTSSQANPSHSYAANGTYTVTLTTSNCDLEGLHTSVSDTVIEFCSHTPVISSMHPWLCENDTLYTQAADAYQWYSGGAPIPETNQYLAGYGQYNSMSFSVRTTVGGCTELSQQYNATPEWSGYYFDAAMGGDPCEGDTAIFAVLHINGFLNGSEIIRWYKDGVLLAAANGSDTLLITAEGSYRCGVINPLSDCPSDTTFSSDVTFICSTLGMEPPYPADIRWKLYPNPASEFMTLELDHPMEQEEIRIYSITGNLVKTMPAASVTMWDISALPSGTYYIRLKNEPRAVIRFIKL